jgi:hypothetical protein
MSYNSNLGYAELNPYVGGQFVNSTNSQYAGNFGSNETQGGSVCNNSMMRGGGTKWQDSVRRKIKNITRKYRKMAKKRSKSMRKRMRSRYSSKTKSKSRNYKGGYTYKSKSSRKSSGKKRQSGGYAQYGSNMPYPSSYSLGGNLSASQSSLATPPPFAANAAEVDNYNRFTNQGFSSQGN